jgi:hypothetical protein
VAGERPPEPVALPPEPVMPPEPVALPPVPGLPPELVALPPVPVVPPDDCPEPPLPVDPLLPPLPLVSVEPQPSRDSTIALNQIAERRRERGRVMGYLPGFALVDHASRASLWARTVSR